MKALDNTIRYYELLMVYEDTSLFFNRELPEGYHFEFYQDNEKDWIQIHLDSKEFTSVKEGKKIFHDFYSHFLEELNKRCLFIVENKTKEKVGTATVSLLKEPQFGCEAVLDWFAIKKSHQGKHLSKALLARTLQLAHQLNHKQLLLHTQTTTPLAAKIYLDCGFKPLNQEETTGWRILKSLINHDALRDFNLIEKEEIYNKRNIEIEKQLRELYKTDEFNYSIWDKNDLHCVSVYYNGVSHEYDFFEKENQVILKEIKDN